MRPATERPLAAVPRAVTLVLALALAAQIGLQALAPRPVARAAALEAPPPLPVLRAMSLGEPIVLAQLMTLYLQAFDNQPGISIPFLDLDYGRVERWLSVILGLDPLGHYPLLMAAQLYSQVPDPAKQRAMLDLIEREFMLDPNRRWRWLAHVALVAKHRVHDDALALRYAREIARFAPAAPGWARQMHIFILEDIGELESAKILLGGLLASGEVTDEAEIRFLAGRLQQLENVKIQTPTTRNRHPGPSGPGVKP
jgi:hypothetical protein